MHFAYAPERVLPGQIMTELVSNDRVIGGLTEQAVVKTKQIYQTFCQGNIHVTDTVTAELIKLAENSFRDVNIAFANELSIICEGMGVNVWEVISVANRHPRVDILQPGPGVGGHCISVDPWFIVSQDKQNSQLIQTARKVNDYKPIWVVNRIKEIFTTHPDITTVTILGLSFKANIDDLRESPALEITHNLATSLPETTIR